MSSLTGNMGMRGPMGQTGNKLSKGNKANQVQTYTPEMMQLLKQSYGAVGPDSYMSRLAGGDEDMFNELEAPALRQFSGLQGNIASRFSGGGGGAGAMGSRRSSGFQNTMSSAASDFAQKLQATRMGLQQDAIKGLHNMSMDLLGKNPYETSISQQAPKENQWGKIIGTGIGAAGGYFAGGGNPMTAMKGAQMGYNIGSGF